MRGHILASLFLCLLFSTVTLAQKKQITMDDFPADKPLGKSNTTSTAATNDNRYKNAIITLERSGCDRCPAYKLTISGNGRVVYKGDKYVRVIGQQADTINKEQIEKLVAAFNNADYFNLKDTYEGSTTPGSVVTTSISLDGKKTKTVKNYHTAPDSPRQLTDLENIIDELANAGQWIN